MNKYYVIGLLTILLFSCASPEKIIYFQEVEGVQVQDSLLNFEPKIQVGDILGINVSAVDGVAALPFNLYETPVLGNSISNSKPLTYLVDSDGQIQFPILGDLKVEGYTTKELKTVLTTRIGEYIKQPTINIRLTNFKVGVTGEVQKPGAYTIANGRISILDAIILAGDLTIYGNRKNVLLIREQKGKRTFINIDLTNKELFNSPYFYLAQNDVLYVEPNKTRVNNSAVGANTGVILSSVSILISLVAILLN
ncbi:polysaccharide biosynthesis/export family protein [Lutibacter holmesii]|uniref:Polysaccharide biosynthesis/export family protein n=1 Tax=Lutibacter holmesii TaxID=1137985 RepID=A0ABW3WPU4_9FLAO